jgi:hypothetical protein
VRLPFRCGVTLRGRDCAGAAALLVQDHLNLVPRLSSGKREVGRYSLSTPGIRAVNAIVVDGRDQETRERL